MDTIRSAGKTAMQYGLVACCLFLVGAGLAGWFDGGMSDTPWVPLAVIAAAAAYPIHRKFRVVPVTRIKADCPEPSVDRQDGHSFGEREQAAAEQAPADSQELFRDLFIHSPNAVCLFSGLGVMLCYNSKVEGLTGYTEDELKTMPYETLFADDCRLAARSYLNGALNDGPQSFDTVLSHKNGYRLDMRATLVPTRQAGGLADVFLIVQDISESKRHEERIRHFAYYDDKTGLPNRRLFKEKLSDAIRDCRIHGGQLAVLYLDIDRFKLVNDSFGHEYGDMLLLHVAERFMRGIPEEALVARTEGDEFAFCFSYLEGSVDSGGMAARVMGLLEQPFEVGGHHLHLSASMGISIWSPGGHELDEAGTLMKHADIALSRAKERGKGSYQVFDRHMTQISLKKLTIESDLRRALQNRQFELYYQPQMDLTNGSIVGMEALIRWNHPTKGMISPADFIPVAEETGLIVNIGDWVLEEACQQNKRLQRLGLTPITVSVNLSIRQFMQTNLAERLKQILTSTGLAPQYLELEITESMTMDVEHAIRCMKELKELGVKISIDDFGIGYSSLNNLKNFPIDKLKIDQSFVRDIMTDPNDAAIVSTIIVMTHHLRMKVVAEGVETEEQLKFLKVNKCHEVQGYYFSKPLPAHMLEPLLRQRQEAAPSKEE